VKLGFSWSEIVNEVCGKRSFLIFETEDFDLGTRINPEGPTEKMANQTFEESGGSLLVSSFEKVGRAAIGYRNRVQESRSLLRLNLT
jgi:hypothetical protein